MNKRARTIDENISHFVGSVVFEPIETSSPPVPTVTALEENEFLTRHRSIAEAAHHKRRHSVLVGMLRPVNNVTEFLLTCKTPARQSLDHYFLRGQQRKTDKFSNWLHATLGASHGVDLFLALRHFVATPDVCDAIMAFHGARVALRTMSVDVPGNEKVFFGRLEQQIIQTAQSLCDSLSRDACLASYTHVRIPPSIAPETIVVQVLDKLVNHTTLGGECVHIEPAAGWCWQLDRLLQDAFAAADIAVLSAIHGEYLAFMRLAAPNN